MNHFTPGTIHSNIPFVSTSIYFLKNVFQCLLQLKMFSQQKKCFLWSTTSYTKMAENGFKNVNQFPEKPWLYPYHSYLFQLLYGWWSLPSPPPPLSPTTNWPLVAGCCHHQLPLSGHHCLSLTTSCQPSRPSNSGCNSTYLLLPLAHHHQSPAIAATATFLSRLSSSLGIFSVIKS